MSTAAPMAPIHPGEILAEEYLVPLGITQHGLRLPFMCRRAGSTRSCTANGGSAPTPRCVWHGTSEPLSASG
jgi:hypothetical protein